MFLKELRGHENIIEIKGIFEADNNMDIYIVCDFKETDLHQVIKSSVLEPVHEQAIIHQILKALKYMHSGELIHRDLKPSNVLLDVSCQVKICDFGLARSVASHSEDQFEFSQVLTDYVATRWYRAPELLLGSTSYTKGVDIWAVGCILAEIVLKKPLFPGSSTLDQLERIIEVTGKPSPEDQETINSPFKSQMLDSIGIRRRIPLEELIPNTSAIAIDFMKRCFQFNPSKRPSVDELLRHPLISRFHDPSRELDCPSPIRIPLDDNIRLTIKEYRDKLYEEIRAQRQIQKQEQGLTQTTPPKVAVLTTSSGTKDCAQRSANLTPTTCHTNKGGSTPATPASSKMSRSPSCKTLAPPVPHRANSFVPKTSSVTTAAKKRSSSAAKKAVSAPVVYLLNGSRAVISSVTRSPQSSFNSRLVRTPSTSSLAGRARAQSPACAKRPSTGNFR
jgi:mitogen-activated protein kinase 15